MTALKKLVTRIKSMSIKEKVTLIFSCLVMLSLFMVEILVQKMDSDFGIIALVVVVISFILIWIAYYFTSTSKKIFWIVTFAMLAFGIINSIAMEVIRI